MSALRKLSDAAFAVNHHHHQPKETTTMTIDTNAVPNPGSLEAVAKGCTCPRIDNAHGAGYVGVSGKFVLTVGCPLHTPTHTDRADQPHMRKPHMNTAPSHDPTPAETIRIKIMVMVEPDGQWNSGGWGKGTPDAKALADFASFCAEGQEDIYTEYHVIEADVPLPMLPSDRAIQGRVTPADLTRT